MLYIICFLKIVSVIILSPIISGCHVYGSFAVHDTSFDSEHRESSYITRFGLSQELYNYDDRFTLNIYGEHGSMPFYNEVNNGRGGGYGTNEFGTKANYKIW